MSPYPWYDHPTWRRARRAYLRKRLWEKACASISAPTDSLFVIFPHTNRLANLRNHIYCTAFAPTPQLPR